MLSWVSDVVCSVLSRACSYLKFITSCTDCSALKLQSSKAQQNSASGSRRKIVTAYWQVRDDPSPHQTPERTLRLFRARFLSPRKLHCGQRKPGLQERAAFLYSQPAARAPGHDEGACTTVSSARTEPLQSSLR